MSENLDALFEAIRLRLAELGPQEHRRDSFVAHLRSLATWEADANDYPDPGAFSFPAHISVAYAICHPGCGNREFIVDGSTQECQHCGALMFRTCVANYQLSDPGGE